MTNPFICDKIIKNLFILRICVALEDVLKAKVLLIEDSEKIAELIDVYMKEYFDIIYADTGEKGLEIFNNENIDIIILDIVLPGISGLEVLTEVRKAGNTPVIILSSKDLDMDKILGLKMGADDYVTKPFNPMELLARIEVQLRRFNYAIQEDEEFIKYKDLKLDLNNLAVYRNDEEISLMPIEYKLLGLFMENPGHVFTKKQIYESVWDNIYSYDDNTVMVHISKLKKKIETQEKKYIKTIRGLGYRFEK